ncbi:MAG: ATP-dependent Clp protease proteolytic subunit [Brockia lithotrophica]|nr:ATP-dependent Clp protease proteolytic subunit [Brockia lithotrophica]
MRPKQRGGAGTRALRLQKGVRRATVLALLLAAWLAAFGLPVGASSSKPTGTPELAAASDTTPYVLLRVRSPIVPPIADYVRRGLEIAQREGASFVLLELSTPGGLASSAQEIVEAILESSVPVVVYVTPSGTYAASAGAFITLSAHVAAMAPGTRIGAAHPVTVGGDGGDEVVQSKVTEDAAAWMRSIAALRDRNVEAAERAVTESRSYTAEEARELHLIDIVAANRESLLQELDGRQVVTTAGPVVLHTRPAVPREFGLSLAEQILLALSNPDIAYLLMSLGMLGLLVELYNPGAIFPGVLGGLSLILGLYGLGTLEARWSALALVLLGLLFFALELFVPSHGLLAVGGVLAFALGSLFLFAPGIPSSPRPGSGVVFGTILAFASVAALLVTAAVRGARRRVVTGREGLIGREAVVTSDLDPVGEVFLEGEHWRAVADRPVRKGGVVRVVSVEGLTLRVTAEEKETPQEAATKSAGGSSGPTTEVPRA